jgi:hypothetical protein
VNEVFLSRIGEFENFFFFNKGEWAAKAAENLRIIEFKLFY